MDFIKTRDDDETANLIWNDSAVQHEKIAELRNYQVHFLTIMSIQHACVAVYYGGEESLLPKVSQLILALNGGKKHDHFTICINKAPHWQIARAYGCIDLLTKPPLQ